MAAVAPRRIGHELAARQSDKAMFDSDIAKADQAIETGRQRCPQPMLSVDVRGDDGRPSLPQPGTTPLVDHAADVAVTIDDRADTPRLRTGCHENPRFSVHRHFATVRRRRSVTPLPSGHLSCQCRWTTLRRVAPKLSCRQTQRLGVRRRRH
jgi:hypothetical protein